MRDFIEKARTRMGLGVFPPANLAGGGRHTRFANREGCVLLPGLPGRLPGATRDFRPFRATPA